MKNSMEFMGKKIREFIFNHELFEQLNLKDMMTFMKILIQQKLGARFFMKMDARQTLMQKILYEMGKSEREHMQCLLNTANRLQREFYKQKLSVVFIKGFALSEQIYNNSYSRSFNDLDILCKHDEMVRVCKVLENLGYQEKVVRDIGSVMKMSDEDKEIIYTYDAEKQFVPADNRILIEVKDQLLDLSEEEINRMIEERENLQILSDEEKFELSCLNRADAYVLLLLNTYSNFETEHGVLYNHYIRDLLDVYYFTKNIDDDSFDRTMDRCKEQKIEGKVKCVYLLMKAFFEEIPREAAFVKLTENFEPLWYVNWDMNIFERLFDPERRILSAKTIRQGQVISKKPDWTIVPHDINKYDFEAARFVPERVVWSYPLLYKKGFFTAVNVLKDERNLYLGILFSRPLESMAVCLCFLIQEPTDCFEKKITCKIKMDTAEIDDSELGQAEVKCKIAEEGMLKLILKIPMQDKSVFKDRCYYYFYAHLGSGNGFDPIGQGTADTPIIVELESDSN